jgi:uncharacterized SAM-binding protein YcdF (DUF218 family)
MFVLGKIVWFLLTPSNLLTVLAAGGLLLALTGWRPRQSLIAAAIGVLGLLVCGFSPLAYWSATALERRFPPPRPLPEQVTGIVVLGGGVRLRDSARRDTLFLSEAGDRLVAMADLARRYPNAKLVISGGSGDLFNEGEAEADLVRAHARMLGIDPSRIIVEDRSRTTYENAMFTRELIKPAEGEAWLLVTSAWHMPRAVGAFRQAGFPVIAYPVDYRAVPGHGWRTFSEVAAGLQMTDTMAKEWVGIIAYRLMGRTDALFPSAIMP